MFHIMFFVFCCTFFVSLASPQTYFHTNHGSGASFTSVSHGHAAAAVHQVVAQTATYQQPQQKAAYQAPSLKPFVHQPSHATYQSPKPSHATYQRPQQSHTTYQRPQPSHTTYQSPQPAYNSPATYQPEHPTPPVPKGPGVTDYSEKCAVDYVEKPAEVCIPKLDSNCEQKDTTVGLVILQKQECQTVTRTICTENVEVAENEVCAYSFHLVPVDTEVKLADVRWEKSCSEEAICVNPHHVVGGYAAPTHCKEEYRHVCYLQPIIYPLVKKVTVKLPQPLETCITKTIQLPRVECEKVNERRCMDIPFTKEKEGGKLTSCQFEFKDPDCQDTVIQLPRQGCPEKIVKRRTVYEVEETVSYSG